MVRPEVIRKRLNKLDGYIAVLETLRKYDFNEFSTDPLIHGSAERYLHLAIESINDMGNHIVSDDELGIVNQYSDIPRLICEKGLISEQQMEIWIKMIGFRNTLVHDYADIDYSIVYRILHDHLDDLKKFRPVFARYL